MLPAGQILTSIEFLHLVPTPIILICSDAIREVTRDQSFVGQIMLNLVNSIYSMVKLGTQRTMLSI